MMHTSRLSVSPRQSNFHSTVYPAHRPAPQFLRLSPTWWLVIFALIGLMLWQSARPAFAEERLYVPMIPAVQTEPGGTGTEPKPNTCVLTAEEQVIANAVISDPGQKRANPICDPTLVLVARARARDMAQRGYFAHVNPDGIGPNYLVREAGYVLPEWYGDDRDDNNVESIAGGQPTPEGTWNAWLNSEGHRLHVLGEHSFYAAQDAFGIGHYYDPNSRLKHYWVFLSAPREEE